MADVDKINEPNQPSNKTNELSEEAIKARRHTRRVILGFSISSFLNDSGSDMLLPLMPLYILSIGGSMAFLGFLDGLGAMVVSFSALLSGYISDRLGRRKPFIWVGYLASGLARFGYGLAVKPIQLIAPKVIDRMGKVRETPRDAVLADAVKQDRRGRGFGILRMMDHAGAFTGALTALILISFLPLHIIFYIAAVPTLISVVVILLVIPEKRGKVKRQMPSLRKISGNGWLLLTAIFISSLGIFSYSFLIIYATRAGFRNEVVPALYLIMTAVSAIFSFPFGRLCDHIGRRWVTSISFLFFIAMCALGALLLSPWVAIVLLVLFGLFQAAYEPSIRALTCEVSPPELRGTALGGAQLARGIAALPASWMVGYLWDNASPAAGFGLAGGLVVLGLVLLLFVKEGEACA